MAQKVYISPSDQERNIYAAGNTTEAIQCRAIAQLLVAALNRCGFDAITNVTDGMYDRVAESNAWGADLHICIHTNAFNGNVSGTRIFCYKLDTPGYEVCKSVMATLAPITPGGSDGVSAYPQLYEERETYAPCCYIEVEFHDVPAVAEWIIVHKPEIAEAICKGVCNYYGVKYNEGSPVSEEKRYYYLGDITEEVYRQTVDKLIKMGILRGKGGEGERMIIDLGEDVIRMLVVLDRAGVFD